NLSKGDDVRGCVIRRELQGRREDVKSYTVAPEIQVSFRTSVATPFRLRVGSVKRTSIRRYRNPSEYNVSASSFHVGY
ncbi:hypothetical protein EDD18DRAFT_1075299, partial [Armillaria luteobubalina]